MKRVWTLVFMVMVAFLSLNVCKSVYAAEEESTSSILEDGTITTTTIEYMEDGSYIKTTITSKRLDSEISTCSSTSSSSFMTQGTKSKVRYNSSGDELWEVSVTGTFRVVTGVTSTCTNATGTVKSYQSDWKVGTATTAYSGNTARATATAKQYLMFIKVDTDTLTVALACDVYGNMN